MSEAEKYPVDLDALNKGDVVSIEQIERYAGAVRGTEKFRLGLLHMRKFIERGLLRTRGLEVTLIEQSGSLKICTDAEAAVVNPHNNRIKRKGQVRGFRRLAAVDREALTEEQRQAYDRSLLIEGRYIQSMQEVKKEVRSLPYKRDDQQALPRA